MKRLDYLIMALKIGLFKKTDWTIRAFSIIHEGPDDWKRDPYHCRIVPTPTGYFFVNAEGQLEAIEETDGKEPLFNHREQLVITPEEAPNLTKPELLTSIGNLFYNYLLTIYGLDNKHPYVNSLKKGNVKVLEDFIVANLADVPENGLRDPKVVYVDDLKRFNQAVLQLRAYTQLWTIALTRKALLPPPNNKELRDKLLKEYAGSLSDPTTIARINEILTKNDAAWLEGDPSLRFMIDGKSLDTVRRKLFLMMGAEPGLVQKATMDLIVKSLDEGWDINALPDMLNSMRAGSFARGAETMLGGEAYKWLIRASSNLNILKGDCGSVLGFPTTLDESEIKRYIGFHLVGDDGKAVQITQANASDYKGKTVLIRSPQFCKHKMTDYCEVCSGPRLALNPRALSAAVSNLGSTLMYISMKQMHAKALKLQKLNFSSFIK